MYPYTCFSLVVVIVTFGCEMAKDCKALILEAETGNLASRIDLSSLSNNERSQESSMARVNVVFCSENVRTDYKQGQRA